MDQIANHPGGKYFEFNSTEEATKFQRDNSTLNNEEDPQAKRLKVSEKKSPTKLLFQKKVSPEKTSQAT